jgi:hypothetical protein
MTNKKNKRKNNKKRTPAKKKIPHSQETSNLSLSESKDFSLEHFELKVYKGEFVLAANYLIRLLRTYEVFTLLALKGESAASFNTRKKKWHTRLASACCALFVNPKWDLSDDLYFFICRFQDWLGKIYEMSFLESGNYVVELVGATEYVNEEQMLKRFYLHTSLKTSPELYKVLLKNKSLALPAVLSMVGDSCTLDEKQEENKSILIQNFGSFSEGAELSDNFIGGVHKPWMFCSYAVDEHRHLVKMGINKIIEDIFKMIGPAKHLPTTKDKPKLAVMIEVCREDHSMYRCYGPILVSLKQYFEITFYATKESVDNTVTAIADRYIVVDYSKISIQQLAESVKNEQFDMVYYPSVGMSAWTILLSNLRLAPVQCCSTGHPATTCSSTIDFVVIEEDVMADPLCFTEKIVLERGVAPFFPHPTEIDANWLDKKSVDGTIRVAIVSKYMKINGYFLSVCREIIAQSNASIEFHFFPDAQGLLLEYLQNTISNQLPGSKIHPYLPYKDYMEILSDCDVRIGTFPFGGSNSSIDCFMLGVPFLTLDGPEVFNHCDTAFIDRYCPKLHDDLVSETVDEFIQKIVRIIDDDDYRNTISEAFRNIDLNQSVFLTEKNKNNGVSGESFYWAYRNFDSIMNSDSQVAHVTRSGDKE